ncbi:MAG: NAD(P)H-hydrate epimerase, partial [Oscillospiraceae bacterium]|nr:NAD(P)H-hydrate epimerase [Oscillospiraceae bacterium]
MKWATAAQMKTVDETAIHTFHIPSLTLMERAAEGLAAEARGVLPAGGKVAVLCGSGNNGGDGLACGRILAKDGFKVRVFLVGSRESMTADSRANEARLAEAELELEDFSAIVPADEAWIAEADAVVDAVFGVGLNRVIEKENYLRAIGLMNASRGVKIAADIASGINADSGEIMGAAVKADRTVTFTALKRGHIAKFGAEYSGRVKVWDIGIGEEIIRKALGEDD